MNLSPLERRILDISYKKNLSHLSSCLTAVGIIDTAYQMMTDDDVFVLSSGHAGLGLYCVLEKYRGHDAEKLFDMHGVHPNRDTKHGIESSAGSLGHGLGIALGIAIARPEITVYVLTSDGEWSEGSMWEALRVAAEQKVQNLVILVNANGTGAYKEIDSDRLEWQIRSFIVNNVPKVSFVRTDMKKYPYYLQGIAGHYAVLTKEQYERIIHAP